MLNQNIKKDQQVMCMNVSPCCAMCNMCFGVSKNVGWHGKLLQNGF